MQVFVYRPQPCDLFISAEYAVTLVVRLSVNKQQAQNKALVARHLPHVGVQPVTSIQTDGRRWFTAIYLCATEETAEKVYARFKRGINW